MDKVKCKDCGALILPNTAEKNNGLCMPCKKLTTVPEKSLPATKAMIIAALILFANALFVFVIMFTSELGNSYIVGAIVDLVLAVFLVKGNENIKKFVVFRAVLGFIVILFQAYSSGFGGVQILELIAQTCLSGSLILLLAWETVRWRFNVGIILAVLYALYLGLAVYGLLVGQNV